MNLLLRVWLRGFAIPRTRVFGQILRLLELLLPGPYSTRGSSSPEGSVNKDSLIACDQRNT